MSFGRKSLDKVSRRRVEEIHRGSGSPLPPISKSGFPAVSLTRHRWTVGCLAFTCCAWALLASPAWANPPIYNVTKVIHGSDVWGGSNLPLPIRSTGLNAYGQVGGYFTVPAVGGDGANGTVVALPWTPQATR